jgi:AraC-like DNA-binding protein
MQLSKPINDPVYSQRNHYSSFHVNYAVTDHYFTNFSIHHYTYLANSENELSLSIDKPLLLFCLDHEVGTQGGAIREARLLKNQLHILYAGSNPLTLLLQRNKRYSLLCMALEVAYLKQLDKGEVLAHFIEAINKQQHTLLTEKPLWATDEMLTEIQKVITSDTLSERNYYLLHCIERLLAMSVKAFSGGLSNPRKIEEAKAYIDANLEKTLSPSELAREAGLKSIGELKQFKDATGMSVTGYVSKQRAKKARTLLATTTHDLTVVATLCGFGNAVELRHHFKKAYEESPSEYRERMSVSK